LQNRYACIIITILVIILGISVRECVLQIFDRAALLYITSKWYMPEV